MTDQATIEFARDLGLLDSIFVREGRVEGATVWTIGNGIVEASFQWSPGQLINLRSWGRLQGRVWSGVSDQSCFHLRWRDGEVGQITSVEAGVNQGAQHLALTLRAPMDDGALVTIHVRCHEGQAVMQQWLSVEVDQPRQLASYSPLRLALRMPYPEISTIAAVQRQGGYRPMEGVYRSFRLERRPLDRPMVIDSGLRSTWSETPWAALSREDAGVFVGLQYAAAWKTFAHPIDDERASIEFSPTYDAPVLAPDTPWTSPIAFFGAFVGDLDDAAVAQLDFFRGVLSPVIPSDFPWVQYNTWFSYLCDLNDQQLRKEVEIAADLGVEVFYVDAGWWIRSPEVDPRDNFASGLGVWRENRNKFPNGLRAFGDYVREHGMRFGLWVEPERVDLRAHDEATWKTSWLATNDKGIIRADWPRDTETGMLCFGLAEVQDWAFTWISDLVRTLDLAWLKWDANYWERCENPNHPHGAQAGEGAQVAGVLKVEQRLREAFPNLVIENCAGGGTRMDFASATQTHIAWLNDASDPAQRVRFHISGATYIYPPAQINAWLVESVYERYVDREWSEPALRSVVRTRMMGALGLSCRLEAWRDDTRRIVREEIERYKAIRHLLREGYLAHLLPQPDLICPMLAPASAWEAFQLRSADSAESVVFAFRNAAIEDTVTVKLKALDLAQTYRVEGEGVQPGDFSGHDLLTMGARFEAPLLASAFAIVRAINHDRIDA